jgi:hypothetical protein
LAADLHLSDWLEEEKWITIKKERRRKVANTIVYRQTERWKFNIDRGWAESRPPNYSRALETCWSFKNGTPVKGRSKNLL